jgi:hypothetical protein
VKVDAVVRVPETVGDEDQAEAYEIVAGILLRAAVQIRTGHKSGLIAIEEPVLRFTASGGPGSQIPGEHPV